MATSEMSKMIYSNTQRVALDLRDDAEAVRAAKALAKELRRAITVTNPTTGERWVIPFTLGMDN